MTALFFETLRPQDRVAVKPHAGPVFHAIQYLLGNETRERLETFRGFGGTQSYPSRTKDHDNVDFSTGSEGLGTAMTVFAALAQDYVRAKGLEPIEGRFVSVMATPNSTKATCSRRCWKVGSTTSARCGG